MKKTILLKSMRTYEGASQFLATHKNKFPEGAVVVKGMLDSCDSAPIYPSGGQIVIYESLSSTTEALKDSDVDEFVSVLLDKDLLEISSSGVHISGKLYDLLSAFNKKAFERLLKKSIDAGGALAQALETQDLEGDEEDEVRKSITRDVVEIIKAMSQDEASNINQDKVAISDAEALADTEARIPSPSGPALPKDDAPAPDAANMSQEDASNHKGNTRTTKIPETNPEDPENDIENSGKRLFKSLNEATRWQLDNPNFWVRDTTFEERLHHGRRYLYTAVEKEVDSSSVFKGAFGNRIVR